MMLRYLVYLVFFYINPIQAFTQESSFSPAYHLANKCFEIAKANNGRKLYKNKHKNYQFKRVSKKEPEAFFLKPTKLGSFLLMDRDGHFFAKRPFGFKADLLPSEKTEWQILFSEKDYILSNSNIKTEAQRTGKLRLIQRDLHYCRKFAEAELDAQILSEDPEPDPQNRVNRPIYGFADLHAHLAFPAAMGGLAMPGGILHKYGIEHALGSCEVIHGENGSKNLLELRRSKSFSGYDTSGYPDFPSWPNRRTATHVTAYYKWLQRAHLSGLKLMVTSVTGNPTFCQILSVLNGRSERNKCSGIDAARAQIDYIYNFINYVDAQAGGPGKGFVQIAKSPKEAREIIANDKMALVLGIEHGALFNCNGDEDACSTEFINQSLDEVQALGVNSIFPIHRFDNSFGGTKLQGGSDGAWMHLASRMSTSKVKELADLIRADRLLFKPIGGFFYDVDHCPKGIKGASSMKNMQDFVEEDFSYILDNIGEVPVIGEFLVNLLDAVLVKKLDPVPTYDEFQSNARACNTRGLTPLGRHLIHEMIKRGMILEIDHMSYFTQVEAFRILEKYHYSGIVSSHSWLENNSKIRKRIFRLGGVLVPMKPSAKNMVNWANLQKREMADFPYLIGIGVGADIQGVHTQPPPDPENIIRYPFRSIDGRAQFTQPKTGNRSFHFTTEGLAHYGLLPEWVESFKKAAENDDPAIVEDFMRSAEAYIQMWERARSQALALKL